MKAVYASCIFLWTALLSPCGIKAQQTLDELLAKPSLTIEGIESGITDIEVDQEGNIYLLWPEKHKLIKRFMTSGYDSVQVIGGKGLGREGFNFPTKIAVPNRQSVFLLDQMNRRVVQFNTNLKVIDDINFLTLDLPGQSDVRLWPISFVVGPTGDLFLLNQEDFKIYKLNAAGKFERSFGGMDFGTGSVQDPWDLAINDNSVVFAIDSTTQEVLQFDLFGTYLSRTAPTLPFRWHHVVTGERALLFLGENHLYYHDLQSLSGSVTEIKGQGRILDAAIGGKYLYVLFENRINLYAFE